MTNQYKSAIKGKYLKSIVLCLKQITTENTDLSNK